MVAVGYPVLNMPLTLLAGANKVIEWCWIWRFR